MKIIDHEEEERSEELFTMRLVKPRVLRPTSEPLSWSGTAWADQEDPYRYDVDNRPTSKIFEAGYVFAPYIPKYTSPISVQVP